MHVRCSVGRVCWMQIGALWQLWFSCLMSFWIEMNGIITDSLIGFTVGYLNKYYLFQNIFETNNLLVLDSFVWKLNTSLRRTLPHSACIRASSLWPQQNRSDFVLPSFVIRPLLNRKNWVSFRLISPPNVPLQTFGRLGFRLERLLVTRFHKQRRNGHRYRVKHGAFVTAPVGRPSKQNTIWKGYITNQNRGMVLPLHSQLQLKVAFGSAAVATKTPTFAAQSAERVPVKRAKNKKTQTQTQKRVFHRGAKYSCEK